MWRRFVPRRKRATAAPQTSDSLRTIRNLEEAALRIDELRSADEPTAKPERQAHYRDLLIIQTPRAVLAQIQMDSHKHGYHNREKRLYELIEFNDTFVNFVLATPHEQLPGLAATLKHDMDTFCRTLNTPMFSDEQYDAIVRGLSREIAVYRTARYHGFETRMTSRADDAFGIDLVIIQPETGKQLNIDCKTPAAFRHRLEDLVHHGRIAEDDLLRGDAQGYLTVIHRRGDETVPVTLFCILPDRLGELTDFTFDEPQKLKTALDTLFDSVA